jgi:hypothetical protein
LNLFKLFYAFNSFFNFQFLPIFLSLFSHAKKLNTKIRSWNKRKTHSWKSIFQRGERRSNNSIKSKFISNPIAAKETVSKIEKKLEGQSKLPVIVSASNSTNSSFKEKKLAKSKIQILFSLDGLNKGKYMQLNYKLKKYQKLGSNPKFAKK